MWRAGASGREGSGFAQADETPRYHNNSCPSPKPRSLTHSCPYPPPGTIEGFHRYCVKGQPYPAIAESDTAKPVPGLLVCDLNDEEDMVGSGIWGLGYGVWGCHEEGTAGSGVCDLGCGVWGYNEEGVIGQ